MRCTRPTGWYYPVACDSMVGLGHIMPGEISRRKILCDLTYMCNLRKPNSEKQSRLVAARG